MASESMGGPCLCGAVAYEIKSSYLFSRIAVSVHAANLLLDIGQFKWLRGE